MFELLIQTWRAHTSVCVAFTRGLFLYKRLVPRVHQTFANEKNIFFLYFEEISVVFLQLTFFIILLCKSACQREIIHFRAVFTFCCFFWVTIWCSEKPVCQNVEGSLYSKYSSSGGVKTTTFWLWIHFFRRFMFHVVSVQQKKTTTFSS